MDRMVKKGSAAAQVADTALESSMAEKHFYEQIKHTESYLAPYFRQHLPNWTELKILEIGCAEGGFLEVLQRAGVQASGVELEAARVEIAKAKNPRLNILVGDITDAKIVEQIGETFDLIVMRDVIEHIPDRHAAFSNIARLLNDNGRLYITFPPRFSGFAGHQQNARSFLKIIPYLHLLPDRLLRLLGRMLRENPALIESVILNYHQGLSIRSFERYCRQYGFQPVVKELFLFRPVYKTRFNLTPAKIPNIPLVREILAFGCECLLQKR